MPEGSDLPSRDGARGRRVRPILAPNETLLQAIREDPDSDAPRLAYAAWLEENGDRDRAEFIRLQLELFRTVVDQDRWILLATREKQLLDARRAEWLRDFPAWCRTDGNVEFKLPGGICGYRADRVGFTRGFVESLMTEHLADFAADLAAICRVAPLLRRATLLFASPKSLRPLIDTAALANLTTLKLVSDFQSHNSFEGFFASPHLGSLECLDLGLIRLGPRMGAELAAASLPRLTRLGLFGSQLGLEGVRALAEGTFPRLRELDLGLATLGDVGLIALMHAAAHFPALTRLRLCDNAVGDRGVKALADSALLAGLESLNLEKNRFTPQGVSCLVHSPHAANLTYLDLSRNRVRNFGAIQISKSLHLGKLQSLVLYGTEIGDRGARALAAAAGLENLVDLYLKGNSISPENHAPLRQRYRRVDLGSLRLHL